MAFAFYFLFQDSSSKEAPLNNETLEEKHTLVQAPIKKAPEILAAKTIDPQPEVVKVIEPASRKATVEIEPKEEIVKAEEPKEDIIEEDLYQPIYDKLIVRSRAKAFFILYDAKGKLLEPKIVMKVRIWRNIRENWWLEDDAYFNHETSVLTCDGFGRQGLEPGRYSVWVDGGGYGTLEFNFQINKDEEYHASFQMPHFTKTIAVHFVDTEGKNVEYIRDRPTYKSVNNAEPVIAFNSKKTLILRSSPAENVKNKSSLSGGSSGEGRFGSISEIKDLVYQTNLGKMYVRVFSGHAGEINYQLTKEGSFTPFSLKSKFEEIDSVTITINKIAEINATTKIIAFDKNENNESLGINVNELIPPKIKPALKSIDFGSKGFNYKLKSTKFPLLLEYQNVSGIPKTIKDDGFEFQHIFPYTEIEDTISVRLVDKKIFKTPWEEIKLEKGRMIYLEGEFPLQKFQVQFSLSPTFFEMAKDFAEIKCAESSFALPSTRTNLYFDSFFVDKKKLFDENLSDLNFNIPSKLSSFLTATRDRKLTHKFLPKGFIDRDVEATNFQVPLKLNSNEIIKSYSKVIESTPIQNALILRAINYNVSGIPWVEASLIKSEDLKVAMTVKRAISDYINADFLKSLTDKDLNNRLNKEMNDVIAKKLNQIFPNKKELEYFLLNGSWYNASARSFSDSAGYLILNSEELIPGKKYTLYLWCRSQDELVPDKEVSFIAQKGITDLGAIRFD